MSAIVYIFKENLSKILANKVDNKFSFCTILNLAINDIVLNKVNANNKLYVGLTCFDFFFSFYCLAIYKKM